MSDSTYSNHLVAEPITQEMLERTMGLLHASEPQVCCVACRREGSWLEVQSHWETFADGETRLWHIARCICDTPPSYRPELLWPRSLNR